MKLTDNLVNEMEENVEEISNDIVVLEYHGGYSFFFKIGITR